MMDRILFGDNQFLGVNHQDPAKASDDLARFSETKNILEVLGYAYDAGIRSFVFTHHPRFDEPFREIRRNNLYPDLKLYPCLPYAHKYNDLLSSEPAIKVLFKEIRKVRATRVLNAARAVLSADIWRLISALVSAEVDAARFPRIDGLFLQNVATDLALGFGQAAGLASLTNLLRDSIGVELGFITMNHGRLTSELLEHGVNRPLICSSINVAGYRMNPAKSQVEDSIRANESDNIAMSVMVSGIIDPERAVEYVCGLRGVNSILFGSSKENHIRSFVELVKKFDQLHSH